MTLAEYLDKHQDSQAELARRAGITPGYLCQILQGIRRPSPDVAWALEKATGGVVTRLTILYPPKVDAAGSEAKNGT